MADHNAAVTIAPQDPVAYDNRGIGLSTLGKHAEAIADFTRAIALDPHDFIAYSNRATVSLVTGRREQAIADLTEVIRAEPADGTAYDRQGETEKALADYRSAVRLRPSFAPAVAALGRLLKDKDPDTALSQMSEAIRLVPRESYPRKANEDSYPRV